MIIDGLIVSAWELPDEEVKQIEDKLSKQIGQDVRLRREVDRSLIGGFIITIKHHRYDYSIKSKLYEMRKYLVQ